MLHYPQQVVVHKTGLSPNTLRAWERRYDGITPDRDDRGRRVYSEELLEKLILLSILVDQGYRIGELADRPNRDLRALTESLDRSQPTDIVPNPSLDRAVQSIVALDDIALWSELERATRVYGRLDVIDSFVFPVTHVIKDGIQLGRYRDVHLSFMRASFRTFLSTLLAPIPGDPQKPVVVFGYPPGQVCDLGGIASAVHIHAAGWHPLLLGGSVPAEQIVAAVEERHAAAVIVAAVTERYDVTILNEMARVRRGVDDHIPVYVGGHMPEALVEDIAAAGLLPVPDMARLRQELGRLVPFTLG